MQDVTCGISLLSDFGFPGNLNVSDVIVIGSVPIAMVTGPSVKFMFDQRQPSPSAITLQTKVCIYKFHKKLHVFIYVSSGAQVR